MACHIKMCVQSVFTYLCMYFNMFIFANIIDIHYIYSEYFRKDDNTCAPFGPLSVAWIYWNSVYVLEFVVELMLCRQRTKAQKYQIKFIVLPFSLPFILFTCIIYSSIYYILYAQNWLPQCKHTQFATTALGTNHKHEQFIGRHREARNRREKKAAECVQVSQILVEQVNIIHYHQTCHTLVLRPVYGSHTSHVSCWLLNTA